MTYFEADYTKAREVALPKLQTYKLPSKTQGAWPWGARFQSCGEVGFCICNKKMKIFIYIVSGLLEKAGQSCKMQRYIFALI